MAYVRTGGSCSKKGCTRRTFMDSDRCFDHQSLGMPWWFKIWFVICAVLAIGWMVFYLWAGINLVEWVQTK